MIIHDVEQNSDEWLRLRCGIPTASEFAKIITSTGRPSKQIDAYARKLAAELYAGKPLDVYSNNYMERGHEQESEARDLYALTRGVAVAQVGFVTDDSGSYGCSPDGLIDDDGMLEIKTRKAEIQVETLASGSPPSENIAQMQGQMWICNRKWVDYISYHPDLPMFVFRVAFDQHFAAAITTAVRRVITARDNYLKILKENT